MRGNGWTNEFQWRGDKSDDASSAAMTNCNAERGQKIDAETGALETASTSRSTSSSSSSIDLARNISASSYSDMLSNDDIVIEDNATTATATTLSSGAVEAANGRRNSNGSSSSSGTSSSRAGATLRGLADDELPQPDTVRRAKDMFEALAQKYKAEEEQQRSSWTLPRRKDGGAKSASIGRSQSMIMLTGRAWCNGGHMVANHHRACSAAINGTRAVMQLGRSNTLPPVRRRFQRSCSDLDKFFRKHGFITSNVESSNSSDNDEDMDDDDESDDADDEWSRKDTGSPVSTEVMRKIREHGLCVTFFGGQGFVEDAPSSDNDDYDDYNNNAGDIRHNQLDHHHHNGHNLHHHQQQQQQQQQQDGDDDDTSDSGIGGGNNYPYELYRSGQGSPSPSSTGRRVPKIVSFLPKVVANGLTSGSTANSTSTTNDENSSWVLTMDELKSTFNGHQREEAAADVAHGVRSAGSSMASSHNGGGPRWMAPSNRVHGRWQRNPYWQGSYYVIYDFTIRNNNDDDDDDLNEAENDINNELLQSDEQTNGEVALEY